MAVLLSQMLVFYCITFAKNADTCIIHKKITFIDFTLSGQAIKREDILFSNGRLTMFAECYLLEVAFSLIVLFRCPKNLCFTS